MQEASHAGEEEEEEEEGEHPEVAGSAATGRLGVVFAIDSEQDEARKADGPQTPSLRRLIRLFSHFRCCFEALVVLAVLRTEEEHKEEDGDSEWAEATAAAAACLGSAAAGLERRETRALACGAFL